MSKPPVAPFEAYAMQPSFSIHEAACLLIGWEPFLRNEVHYRLQIDPDYQEALQRLQMAALEHPRMCVRCMAYKKSAERARWIDEMGDQRMLPANDSVLVSDIASLREGQRIDVERSHLCRWRFLIWLENEEPCHPWVPYLREVLGFDGCNLSPAQRPTPEHSLGTWNAQITIRPEEYSFADPDSKFYSSKLAASFEANNWLKMYGHLYSGMSQKQKIEMRLVDTASYFNLLNGDGSINQLALSDCAKIAHADDASGPFGNKLGAAIAAHSFAMTTEKYPKHTFKQKCLKYLGEHRNAEHFGITHNGRINNTALDECARITNIDARSRQFQQR